LVIGELALKVSTTALQPHVPALVAALLRACGGADAWPVRDVAVLALGRFRLRFGSGDDGDAALTAALLACAFDTSRAVREHAAAVLGEVAATLAPPATAAAVDAMRAAAARSVAEMLAPGGELPLPLDGALFLLRARQAAAGAESSGGEDGTVARVLDALACAGGGGPVALGESACRILLDVVPAAGGRDALRPHLDALLPLVAAWATATATAAERARALVAGDLLRALAAALGPAVMRARLAALAHSS
jgi:hypothetical protein